MSGAKLANEALKLVGWQGASAWHDTVRYLVQQHGASEVDANRVLLDLVRAGALVQTSDNVLLLGARRAETHEKQTHNLLSIAASALGIVAAVFAISEVLFRSGVVPGDSPLEVLERFAFPSAGFPANFPPVTFPDMSAFPAPVDERPATPKGLSLSGDCDAGFMLNWDSVNGAESYRVERDNQFFASVRQQTWHNFPAFGDGEAHRYTVAAVSLFGARSLPSDPVSGPACSAF